MNENEYYDKIIVFVEDEENKWGNHPTLGDNFQKLKDGIEISFKLDMRMVHIIEEIYRRLSENARKIFDETQIRGMYVNGQSISHLSMESLLPNHTRLFKIVMCTYNLNSFDYIAQMYSCFKKNMTWPYVSNMFGIEINNKKPIGMRYGTGVGTDRALDNSPKNCCIFKMENKFMAINKWTLVDLWTEKLLEQKSIHNPFNDSFPISSEIVATIIQNMVDKNNRDSQCVIYNLQKISDE